LVCIQASILEHNIDFERALEFKSFLLENALNAAKLIEAKLEFLTRGEGMILLQRINALIIGFYDLANPSPIVQTVLEKPEMKRLRVGFSEQFQSTLETDWLANPKEHHMIVVVARGWSETSPYG
jgi:Tetracyclin repressor-like, C-terminal domain